MGSGYFKALDRFPKDTPITFGLNLAYEGSDSNDTITRMAQAAVDNLQNVKLYSFEVGNEPDLWLENGFRSGAWDGQTYTQQFLERAETVYDNVLKPAGMASMFFEPPATASTIGTTFEIAMLVKDGLTTAVNGINLVSCWNQHDYFYYIGVSTYGITLDQLMNLDKTNEQFAYWEEQVNISRSTKLPYVLREMASVGPIGMHEVSDTFGAALWTLNFFLYTASIGISSVQMHMTQNSNASAWQPIEQYGNDPFVRPQYYAHAAMAQIIGNGNGTTQVASMNTDNVAADHKGYIRAYNVYANGALQSMVLINSKQANSSESNKASFTFEVNFGSSNGNKDIYLSYLTADGADSLSGTTFNGMTFSDSDGKASQVDNTVNKLTTSSSGKVSIPVRDTQAVVANVGWLLGSNAVLNNGTATSSRKSSDGQSRTSGANTATITGAVTTALSVAASLTGGSGNADETGTPRTSGEAEVPGRSKILWALGVSLIAVTIGFVILA
ncbi:hypothetical protein BDV96DRAFT_204758 [Lophiotrema nucula]|uniref:Beta-glucuronidase C-terminal domain-containing protein n=1 Tax=Lophiotrema nucula TaxID=690887 RepID=A0A6A5ZPQ6_9PLEO|nr:hypothetical protein BDV96DRAFT_204758 [Lophiotrema nucula]